MPNSNAGSNETSTVRVIVVDAPVAAIEEFDATWPAVVFLVAVTVSVNGIKLATMPWFGPAPTMSQFAWGFPFASDWGQVNGGSMIATPVLLEPPTLVGKLDEFTTV